jgi:uncharacterized protein
MTEKKTERLDAILKDMRSFVVAFSGGVDSSYLSYHAKMLPDLKFIAVTLRTPYVPKREINEAIEFATKHKIDHHIIDVQFPEIIRMNPVDRCYLCKKLLFNKIIGFARENSFSFVADGTNSDDTTSFRPGLKALKELQIRSPLAESGLTKEDVRILSKRADLPLWSKPAMACLLTRIPFGTEISEGTLKMIEAAEDLLFEKGYPGTRVRVHSDVARIECLPGFLEKIVNDPQKELIIANLKKIGFRYISLDLEGYKTGSFNPQPEKP